MTHHDGRAPGFPDEPWLDDLIAQSLREDVGSGDATTDTAVAPDRAATGVIAAREAGVVAGLPLAARLYAALDPAVRVEVLRRDGDAVAPGDAVARLAGPAASLLTGERTALNFLQYLSGIASQTARYAAAVAGTGCRVLDTRKTLPGYRLLAKYAVRCGGGHNHRLGLHDRILLKDNHWASRRGSLADLVARGRERHPALAIEVEVDTLAQFDAVLPLGVEWILLDNFTPDQVREAVARREAAGADARRTLLEASGNVTLETIRAYAEAGADAASVGRLTHSVAALDLGLDFLPDAGDA
ncbi:MAG TPA: carboxylating nicotinate-nucleotide diphosphorylase [Candidatus Krumholzibacteria bacterium]|nr:carboxylating nicotinate-nucleotide diphosphorylase [Candidatus Krumholzibacteria bacterium]HRX51684.1 carboxylating nicotinate-nucleotide diphosphorylase [Candidatus Krumholzibacteria bacterium]